MFIIINKLVNFVEAGGANNGILFSGIKEEPFYIN